MSARPVDTAVLHLCGPQGSGKSLYAQAVHTRMVCAGQPAPMLIDLWEFERRYEGRVDRAVDRWRFGNRTPAGQLGRHPTLLMLEHPHGAPADAMPPHWMKGDEVLHFPGGAS